MLKAYLRNDSLNSPGGGHNGGLGDGVNRGSQTTKVRLDDGGSVTSHDGGLGVVDGLSDGVSHRGGGGVSYGSVSSVSHGGGSGVRYGSGGGVCNGGRCGVSNGGRSGVDSGGGNDGGSVSVGPGSDALKPSLGQKMGGSRVDCGGLGGGQGHKSGQHHLRTYNKTLQ